MEGKHFSTGEALRFGWNTFKANVGFLIIMMIVSTVMLGVPYELSVMVMKQSYTLGLLCLLVYYVLAAVVGVGYIKIGLKFVDGQKPELSDLWEHWEQAGKFIWSSFLLGLLVMLGFFLLVVPGVLWMLKYYFVPYLVADKNMNVKEAFTTSAKMTDGMKLDLFGMLIVVGLVAMSGYLVFLVGIVVSAPVAMLAVAFIYRTLEKQVRGGATVTATATPTETKYPLK